MKRLKIQTPEFIFYQADLLRWLSVLGYSRSVLDTTPVYVREFFHWLESEGVRVLEAIDSALVERYYRYLSGRKKYPVFGAVSGALSCGTLNNHVVALRKLGEYLLHHRGYVLPLEALRPEQGDYGSVVPLTIGQVQALYEATHHYGSAARVLGFRDRALLCLLYDCGLRRSEAIAVQVSDVDLKHRIVLVRKGKNNTQRKVPFTGTTALHLSDYLYLGRPVLLSLQTPGGSVEPFLLNQRGQAISRGLPARRLRYMQQYTGEHSLQGLRLYPHLLRHSIATHLLYSGMSLDQVSRFLGHRSLDVTQRYTHIVAELRLSRAPATTPVPSPLKTQGDGS